MPRSTLIKLGLGMALVLTLGLLGLALIFPYAAAVACPACYGFQALRQNVYVDQPLTPVEAARISETIRSAQDKISVFYGSSQAQPRILLCTTEKCYRRFGGGRSKGRAVLDKGVLLSPKGLNPVILSHELSHSEVEARIGLIKAFNGTMPTWFNEGLAVVVSDDPRYLAPATTINRCLMQSDEPLPIELNNWIQKASADRRLYAKAACRVDTWLRTKGGPSAAIHLLNQVAAGKPFDKAYQ